MASITKDKAGKLVVIRIRGALSPDSIGALEERFVETLYSSNRIAVEFNAICRFTHGVLPPLLKLAAALKKGNHTLYLINAPSHLRFTLNICKLSHLFEFKSSLDEIGESREEEEGGQAKPEPVETDARPVLYGKGSPDR